MVTIVIMYAAASVCCLHTLCIICFCYC